MPKQPQDHQPGKDARFRFTGPDGKSHTLPPASKGHKKMTGRDLRDAMLGGEEAQFAYMLRVLEATSPGAAALDALYALPQDEMVATVGRWGEHNGPDGDPSLGESSPSSD